MSIAGQARRNRHRRRRRWLRVAVPFLALVLIAAGVWVVGFSAALSVQRVQVTGLDDLGHQRIVRAARVPMRRPLARLDVGAIEQRVTDIKRVESAKVTRSWPNTVKIAVTERKPLYRVKRDDHLLLVDHAGIAFPAAAKQDKKLPRATVDPTQSDLLSDLGTVTAALPKSLRGKIRQVDAGSRDTVELKLTKGRTVIWGNASESELKAKVTAGLLKRKASVYNVSAPGYPTTR